MFNNKLTKDNYGEIIELLKTNITYQEIGNKFNISRERVRQIARQNGLNGLGAKLRRDLKTKYLSEKLKRIYGSFYENGIINKSDFLDICKHKFRNKKSQVLNKTKYSWTVSFGDIDWNLFCPILGIELDYYAEGRQENSPSFDRIDSTKGYIKGNVQIISWRANRIKNDGSSKEHYLIANYLEKLGL